MKENWINKLVELLNEYEKYISKWWLADLREFDWSLHYYSNNKDEYVFDNVYYRIISNGYGFIKRLVKNNKIDLDKRPTRNKYRLQQYKTELWWYGKIDEYSELLMLLSIQDNPISFLTSILK